MQPQPRLTDKLQTLEAGTVLECRCAILLTDVVDSTLMATRIGDSRAAEQWAEHDRLARAFLRQWNGLEIDRTDGMLLLFDSAAEALAWSREYHHALAALQPPMRARASLHFGTVMLRRNALPDVMMGAKPLEVDGVAKPLAARIMAIAQPGQTLISERARETLPEARLRSHGHWLLKGIEEPVELFDAAGEGEAVLPVSDGEKAFRVVHREGLWVPAREVPHTLPSQHDAMIGRAGTLLALRRRFDSGARLVTIAGAGGSGKTRVAVCFGASYRGYFPGGVWFCDLSQARDEAGIAGAAARGLDVTLESGDAIAHLGKVIRARGACLVILDNFEQVVPHARATLARWLDASEAARFLVTSRELLRLGGEAVEHLEPLDAAAGIALFRARAAETSSAVQWLPEDEAALEPLVHLLDGLPLAIELAAARVRVMPPRTLLARISQRFRLLSQPGAAGRQSTLQATFDWSWELLGEPERSALAQLAVFAGGFSLADAEAVVEGLDSVWIPDLIQSLVDKSLLRALADGRFGLLVSVREYALAQLQTPGRYPASGPEALAAAIRRHAAYFAQAPDEVITGTGCANLENAVAACRNAVAAGLPELAEGALNAAWKALSLRGPASTGLELAQAVAAMPLLPATARKSLEHVLGASKLALGDADGATAHFEHALELARASGDLRLQAQMQAALGDGDVARVRVESARSRYLEARRLAVAAGDVFLECEAVKGLGNLHYMNSEAAAAEALYQEGLAIAQRAGAEVLECAIRSNLGNLAMGQGDLTRALDEFHLALQLARRAGRRLVEGNTLGNLGWLSHLRGDPELATRYSEEALAMARHIGSPRLECVELCNLAIIDETAGRVSRAQERFEASIALVHELGEKRWEGQFLTYLGLLHTRQQARAAAEDCFAKAKALLREAGDRMGEGVLLCAEAELRVSLAAPDSARALLEEAQAIATHVGALPDSELASTIGRALARIAGADR